VKERVKGRAVRPMTVIRERRVGVHMEREREDGKEEASGSMGFILVGIGITLIKLWNASSTASSGLFWGTRPPSPDP